MKPITPAKKLLSLALLAGSAVCQGAQLDLARPFGSVEFGQQVVVLPNGNIVVTDPAASGVFSANSGAVHLFRPDGSLISSLKGGQDNDRVGSGRIVVLPSGDFLVLSPEWRNGQQTTEAGAVTWVSGRDGLEGFVGPGNSLVGSRSDDEVGQYVQILANGDYVVLSPGWDNGSVVDAGAITWGPAVGGVRGLVSAENSLVGSHDLDRVGGENVHVLANGGYVACSPDWDSDMAADVGAATFSPASIGVRGAISSANSLVGKSAADHVCSDGIVSMNAPTEEAFMDTMKAAVPSDYVVRSPLWRNAGQANAGAVTRGSGTVGVKGVVSATNSLVGTHQDDQVGEGSVTALDDGRFLVASPLWNRPAPGGVVESAGAVTWMTPSMVGPVQATNSLVGTSAEDRVGARRPLLLAHGGYVVSVPLWDNGAAFDAGAVVFAGPAGVAGDVSPSNALVGTTAEDRVGEQLITLSTGAYVVASPRWNRGSVVDAGAVTFGPETTGVTGPVSTSNSLVGTQPNDLVGRSLRRLRNGNYLVGSYLWNNGSTVDAGAVTFASGIAGVVGEVTVANSLVGGNAHDYVGNSIQELENGNYVVAIPDWDRPGAGGVLVQDAGAATFGSGSAGVVGVVSQANSLMGSNPGDRVAAVISPLPTGNYVVQSPDWNNGAVSRAGAVTFGSGQFGATGTVSSMNSLVGSKADDRVGERYAVALDNGNYLLPVPGWDNGTQVDAGAVVLGSGVMGSAGPIGVTNALIGAQTLDRVGDGENFGLGGGHFVVYSPGYQVGTTPVGAITLGVNDGRSNGVLSDATSVIGTLSSPNSIVGIDFDAARLQLVVGESDANRVTLLRPGAATITTLSANPSPADPGQPVLFTVHVDSGTATDDGRAVVRAANGQSCTDTTPTSQSASRAMFSCTITFFSVGTRKVVAEFLGSLDHAYSASAPLTHTTGIHHVFADGFE